MEEMILQSEYQGFAITDDAKAEWALKKIREAEADKQMWADYYAEQLKKITNAANNTIEYMTHLLYGYFETVPHSRTKGGQEKYKLPSGELIRHPAEIEYERDEDALLQWCRNNAPELIKTKESVNWSELKKRIAAEGLIPDGVEIAEKPEEFKVKL